VLSVDPSFKTIYSKSIEEQCVRTELMVSSIYCAPL